jgi:hypothetical protein
MTLISLQALSWSTVAGAVVSALLLASTESGLSELSRLRGRDSTSGTPPATQPTSAGPQRKLQTAPISAVVVEPTYNTR